MGTLQSSQGSIEQHARSASSEKSSMRLRIRSAAGGVENHADLPSSVK